MFINIIQQTNLQSGQEGKKIQANKKKEAINNS